MKEIKVTKLANDLSSLYSPSFQLEDFLGVEQVYYLIGSFVPSVNQPALHSYPLLMVLI